jgi:hypothetical protein
MKKVFAYTKDQKLSKKVLDALVDAGYIPVPVDGFDCVRVLEPMPDIPIAETSIVFWAALETIRARKSFGSDELKRDFADRIMNAIEGRRAKE